MEKSIFAGTVEKPAKTQILIFSLNGQKLKSSKI
jgi:hypothetical protein